ncbi:PREDICTED: storkhead-box protein 1 [Thamnophis sirtalis]|uniref:Storkhead-box protein 1 n=1 Tax=Thamnophis sirtalis TaxID=35019 RepID=A0A6I9Y9J7_9SAUR|nr:PREDICTED: storkhead-box protein 1 [Thamnophis sirtalis]
MSSSPLPRRAAVQLAPSSLALVLRRREAAGAEAEGAEAEADDCCEDEARGAAVFQAFRRANAACYWNAGLVRAVGRVRLQGWLRGGVLLLQGPPAPLQLLRDAWLRRALRAPKGFLIRAVGDVSPVHMNPISQSQFVPLAEVLCCAISDMNAARITVTQETLLHQLGKYYPGIATPTHDILYSTLGMLIKERKIYHTGEGYFIVTPNTYFISNNTVKSNKRTLLEDKCLPEPSFTYLVSMEDATELAPDPLPIVSHCRSCYCFLGHNEVKPTKCQELNSQEPNGKSQKDSCESRASLPKPTTESLADGIAHSVLSAKGKDKAKRFSLSLFWRNTSKKEKAKKSHSTFSAQFPPEKWPVRDEDNLENIPRDVEHEIIKRINPILTVDNLTKHTALMRKMEEQKKYISKGTSTELLTMKHKHISKPHSWKKQNKAVKYHRKGQHSNEKRGKYKTSEVVLADDHLASSVEHPLCHISSELMVCNRELFDDALDMEPPLLYKREINNPFQDIPNRRNKSSKGYKNQKNYDIDAKVVRTEKHHSWYQSLDSLRTMDCKAKVSLSGMCDAEDDKKKHSDHQQCQALRTDGTPTSLAERATCQRNLQRGTNSQNAVEMQEASNLYATFKNEEEKKHPEKCIQTHCDKANTSSLPSQPSDCYLPTDAGIICQFKQSNVVAMHRQKDFKSETQSKNTSEWLESVNPQYEGFIYDDPVQYQKVDNDGARSPMYNDVVREEEIESSKLKSYQLRYRTELEKWNDVREDTSPKVLGKEKAGSFFRSYPNDIDTVDTYQHEESGFLSQSKSKGTLKEYDKMNLEGETDMCHQVSSKNNEENEGIYDQGWRTDSNERHVLEFSEVQEAENRIWNKSADKVAMETASLMLSSKDWEIKADLVGIRQSFVNSGDAPLDRGIQHDQNHLQDTGNQSITGDSGIDSPRAQSMVSANSVILYGLKKSSSFLKNLEGIEKTLHGRKSLTPNSLLQLTPVMKV